MFRIRKEKEKNCFVNFLHQSDFNSIFSSQLLGCPFYFYDKDRYYTWIARTKRHFGLLIIVITQIWSPTVVKVSGDDSVAGQIRKTRDGETGVELAFPERMVLVANHQVCSSSRLSPKHSYLRVSTNMLYAISYIPIGYTSGGVPTRQRQARTAIYLSSLSNPSAGCLF